MVASHKQKILNEVKSYAIITFGLMLTAIGWTGFLIPAQITGGGASGVGALVFYATGIPVGATFLALNAVLILLAIKVMGSSFGVRTIFGVIGLAFFLGLFQSFIHQPLVKDGFMATVVGGMLSGAGVGITFSRGSSTGGTDIVALMMNKYYNVSPGRASMYCDIIVISLSFLIFHSIEKMVYGYVMMAVASYVIDLMITGSQQSYQIFIITKKHEEVADNIQREVKRGITVLNGQGWYTKGEVKILIVLCKKNEASSIFRLVKCTDPQAFISFGSVMGVYGRGFDHIKA
jgi:uncharacterized membrane-anchored protein YitT (DUF2179 family)